MIRTSRRLTAVSSVLASLLLVLVPAAAGQNVIVIDAAVDGPDLAPFLNNAAHGDLLLIKSGNYTNVGGLIKHKSLLLVGDGPTPPSITGEITVTQVPAQGLVLLRGLALQGAPGPAGQSGARVMSSPDSIVWIEDVTARGADGPGGFLAGPGGPGLYVGAGNAVVIDSEMRGGDGVPEIPILQESTQGGDGVYANASKVAIWDSVVLGGTGGAGEPGSVTRRGGHGVSASNATMFNATTFVSNGDVTGGTGTDSLGGPGSHGLLAFGGQALHVASTFQPGASSSPGNSIEAAGGALVHDLDATRRSLSIPAPVRVGELVALTYTGDPGDLFGIFLSGPATWLPIPFLDGVWHMGVPQGPVVIAFADANGNASLPVSLGALPPGFGFVAGFAQAYAVDALGNDHLSAPTSLVFLDSGF